MSAPLIILSQTARVMSIWSRRTIVKQGFLTVSVIFYTALMMKREQKINEYYSRRNPHQQPEGSDK